jgi:hypothetical protein
LLTARRIYADRSVDCYGERTRQETLPVAWSWHHAHQRISNRRYEFLLALHELVEALLCKEARVSQVAVDAFDAGYEKRGQPGDDSEPGAAAGAPYPREHVIAWVIERLAADLLKVD